MTIREYSKPVNLWINLKEMKKRIAHIFFILYVFAIGGGSCDKQESASLSHSTREYSESVSINPDVKMVKVDGGYYLPFYSADDSLVYVAPYLIDEKPVTNQEFLDFVLKNPQWQRSSVKRIYADSSYLKYWKSDTELPEGSHPDAPIVHVSWFAAKAYATAAGKRLPTLDEWEFAARADEENADARDKKTYRNKILNLYLIKNRQFNPVKQSPPNFWGVYNMFDLIWEWTDDFNSVLVTGDSRTGDYGDKNLVCAGGATSSTDVMNYAAFMRFGMRVSLKAHYAIGNLGFRCATDYINE